MPNLIELSASDNRLKNTVASQCDVLQANRIISGNLSYPAYYVIASVLFNIQQKAIEMLFRICQELWDNFENTVQSFGVSCDPLRSSVQSEARFICEQGTQSANVRLVNERQQNILWAEVTNTNARIVPFLPSKPSFADELSMRIMAANAMIEFAKSEDERAIVRRMTLNDPEGDT